MGQILFGSKPKVSVLVKYPRKQMNKKSLALKISLLAKHKQKVIKYLIEKNSTP